MNLLELTATLGLDKSNYDKGLNDASGMASSFASGVGTVAKIATAAIATTTAATIAGTAAFINGVSSVAEYGNEIDKMSQKMNMSAEAYQEWDFVMEHAGISMDSLKMGIKTLSSAAETGSEAFEQLGISQEQISSMSSEELFSATITALQDVESETERTYLAGQLLGRGATELGPLLNMTAEETDALKQQVHDLGGVLSDETVKAAAQFEDSLQNMKVAFSGVKNSLLSEFLPSFSTVMDGLALVFSGDEGGLALIDEGVNDFITSLNEVVPKVVEIGGRILTSLISAISSNLPKLLSQGSGILSQLIQGIIISLPSLLQSALMILGQIGSALLENAPLLLSTALELVLMLAQGLTEALPSMVPAIVSVVNQIVTTLTQPDNLSLLIGAALQLILALAEGLVVAMPDLISIIPVYYANIITTMINMFPEIMEAVVVLLGDLGAAVFGIIGGLLGMNYDQITGALSNVASALANGFAGFVNAFSNLKNKLTSTVSTLWSSIVGFFQSGLNNAKSIVSGVLNSIKSTFTNIFNGVKTTVENAINYIKGLFNFEWSLPSIKLPHFSISGKLDLLAQPPTYPSVSVSWYKKAMEQPYLLNGATIFGAAGGHLLGGGESGSELVIGTNKLMGMIQSAVGIGAQPITINVYGAAGQDVRELAKEVSQELQNLINDKEAAYA